MKMTKSTHQTSEDGEAFDTPSSLDTSEVETIVTGEDNSIASAERTLAILSDTDQANSHYLDNNSNLMTRYYETEIDRPYYSDDGSYEYHESRSSPPLPGHQEVTDQSCLPDAGEVVDGSGSNPGNCHVIDDYSFLSDADRSGNFETNPNASRPEHEQVINQLSSLSDASGVSNTTIKMENSQEPTSRPISAAAPDSGEVEESGRPTESFGRREGAEHCKILSNSIKRPSLTTMSMTPDNLFFRQDDGTVLAIRIKSASGPELLRGLRGVSEHTDPIIKYISVPFALTAPCTLDDSFLADAQNLSLAEDSSMVQSSSTSVPSGTGSTSINASTPINTNSMHQIFASTDGKAYPRDWIRSHNINEDILKGVPSKHKLDLLVRHGAVVVGDKLCVTYHSSGIPVVKEGEVSLQHHFFTTTTSKPIFHSGVTWLYEQ